MLQENQKAWVEMSPKWAEVMEGMVMDCTGRKYSFANCLRKFGGKTTQIMKCDGTEGVVLVGYQVETPDHLVLSGDEMIRYMAKGAHIMDKFQSRDRRFSGFFWRACNGT